MKTKIDEIKIGNRFRKDMGDLSSLVQSIKEVGLLQPVTVNEDNVLICGQRRIEAYKLLGKKTIAVRQLNLMNMLRGEFDENQIRKDFTLVERADIRQAMKPMFEEEAKARKKTTQFHGGAESAPPKDLSKAGKTRDILAKATGVSHDTAMKEDYIAEHSAPEAIKRIDEGLSTVTQEYNKIKNIENKAKNEELKKDIPELKDSYDVIVIDPPWPIKKIVRDIRPNQTEEIDYPTMSIEEITALIIPAAEDCHLFVWTTHKFLPDTFNIVETWGFKYVCCMVWHKPGGFQPFGLPQYNSEFCLYARKGAPKFIDTKEFSTCFNAKRGRHSEKPEVFYETVKRVTEGKRVDMFGRREIDGFESWGFEA